MDRNAADHDARIARLEYLIDLLKNGGSIAPIITLLAPFTSVSNASPYTPPASGNPAVKFACDTLAGPCAIQLGAVANMTIIIVVAEPIDNAHGPGANPIVITPPGSAGIWDPSLPGYNTTATLQNGSSGAIGWWQYVSLLNKFLEIV
jgi:hypothetical protein